MASLKVEQHVKHLVHSHAHEEDIPGTVNLKAVEGDDTGYGQAFFPVPANDPNDPLQWSQFKKTMILIICCLYSFLGNSALLGPAVYIEIYAEEFNITPSKASGLISYANLAFGFGSLLLVPLYLKIGRRPVMLLSMICFLAGLIGASQATTFNGLMVARVFHGLGSGVCEALPVQLVNDIFFLHERGKRLGWYTICLCFGSTGPLYAGYMLAGGYSWRLFFYVEAAFAGALLIMSFLFVEETLYDRKITLSPAGSIDEPFEESKTGSVARERTATSIPPRKPFLSTLKPWSKIDHDAEFFMTMIRPFSYFFVPAVFWVITTYGINIGLGALAFNYTFPIKIVNPPYNWSQTNSGLIAVASIIAYALAAPLVFVSDKCAAYLTRRNDMVREAEMRLWVLFVPMLIGPAGLLLYAMTAQRDLHWIGYFIGVGMVQWASFFYFTFTLAYAVDSYNANTSEMLIAMNLGKQAISFGMGLYLLEWILQRGYAVVVGGIFVAVLLANNLALIIFVFFGKKIRILTSRTWLGGMHKKTAGERMEA